MAVNKIPGLLVQGDRTQDLCVIDLMKNFIKERDTKKGAVFLGLPHRLDRPVGGVLLLAKTSKALSRLSAVFRDGLAVKIYWALVESPPSPPQGTRTDWLIKDRKRNVSRLSHASASGAKKAMLEYRLIGKARHHYLVEVKLLTGRHHQIRVQLSTMGSPVKGDLKYGARRSNSDGGIDLHARRLELPHPVRQENLILTAPRPDSPLWNLFA